MFIPETYRKIFEPLTVARPGHFAARAMMVTDTGEIRVYTYRCLEHEDGRKDFNYIVLKSNDCGMSFTEETLPNTSPGAQCRSPWSGDYITLHSFQEISNYAEKFCPGSYAETAVQAMPHEPGVFVFRSSGGPDGPWEERKIFDEQLHIQRLPLPLKRRLRWICTAEECHEDHVYPVVLLSDDDGRNWRKVTLPEPPLFDRVEYPHKGMRWYLPGVEPVVAELSSGRLFMLLRTSVDVHYQCFSDDGGETWTCLEPSIFFSVATMPGLYSLKNGRLLAVWNNTTPLPEIDHSTQKLEPPERSGYYEDVFTNRDVLHAAISEDDGISWRGFREIALNPHRNDADFRTTGGSWSLADKSIHQNQMIELPENKVLIHYGQHPSCAGILIFDLGFLMVTERRDDFAAGLGNWSTQLYYNSISGGFRVAGHCAWNRRAGAQLMPGPDDDWREALLIGRHPDKRLFSSREGAVWNFPAAGKGRITLELTMTPGNRGIRISLTDRWINPCDEFIREIAVFSLLISGDGAIGGTLLAPPGKHSVLTIDFSLADDMVAIISHTTGQCFRCRGTQSLKAPFGNPVELSYLHLQSNADEADENGVFIHSVAAAVISENIVVGLKSP